MKRILKTILFTFVFLLILLLETKIQAASATISGKTNVTAGNSVTITVKVTAATWNLKVSGAVSGTIVGVNMDGENETTTKTYKFTPSKAGTYTVNLEGDVTDENRKDSSY